MPRIGSAQRNRRAPPMTLVSRPGANLAETARRVLPAGGFGNFAPEVILRDGKGGRVRDVAGREYVDYLLGSGPMFIGHGHPEVLAAVEAQLPLGTTFFATSEPGIRLAEALV